MSTVHPDIYPSPMADEQSPVELRDQACRTYLETIYTHYTWGDGLPSSEGLAAVDQTILDLVDGCTPLAEQQSEAGQTDHELAWADCAREGFERIMTKDRLSVGLSPLFLSPKQTELQKSLYKAARVRRLLQSLSANP